MTAGLLDNMRTRFELGHVRASTVSLTGLLKGRAFSEGPGQHFVLAMHERSALSVADVDLGDFKRITTASAMPGATRRCAWLRRL